MSKSAERHFFDITVLLSLTLGAKLQIENYGFIRSDHMSSERIDIRGAALTPRFIDKPSPVPQFVARAMFIMC